MKIKPKRNKTESWDTVCFSDSYYSGVPDMRRSKGGFILYILGAPVSWRSNAQRSFTLLFSKDEWATLLESVKEVMLMIQL